MSNMDLVKQWLALVEANDFATLSGLVADNFMLEGPVPEPVGKAEFLGLQQALLVGIPDWKFNPGNWAENGDVVSVTFAVSGTHAGTLNLSRLPGPLAPTGKHIQLPAELSEFTIMNGKLAHLMVHPTPGGGVMGILAQIGVQMPGM